ncbi:hypothetical protein ACWGUP_16370 [Streptomyces diastaticus]|uniref:hypothetical protein n=1 Tax=Streptomyces diastaticus TaxID=1956 RepID=UPI0027844729|nr:hypothetical protein [Streptomyces sp. DSM 41037]
MCDADVVGVAAAQRELAQIGDAGREIVVCVEDGVVEAPGQLELGGGIGDADLGE